MGDNINLRAFVRLDGQNRVVTGSLVMRKNKPKVGKWMEIVKGQCCVPVVLTPFGEQFAAGLQDYLGSTTTTTTTGETTTTTTTAIPEETTTTTTTILM
jgi:hypothetical protein